MKQRICRFELADGGTLFLDEVGELPLEIQVKLLRVLQEGEFERLGSSETLKVNVRIIAATNRSMQEMTEKGDFRHDLYYRLSVFPIHAPSLRERREDIPMLVDHLLKKLNHRLGKQFRHVSTSALEQLMQYDWPGNIRELQNVLERAAIVCSPPTLEVASLHLPAKLSTPPIDLPILTLNHAEKRHIEQALQATKGVIGGKQGGGSTIGSSTQHPAL